MDLQMVSPVLGVLGKSLTSPIIEELGLLWGVGTELEKLTSTVSALQSVLDDAEEKQETSKSMADWLLKLKDAAYDADDILDEWATESGGTQQEHTTLVCTSLLSCVCLKQIKFRHKIAKRMKELNQRFADIASERSMFDLREGGVVRRDFGTYPNRMTGPIPSESIIYGRDEEKAYIVEWLLTNANSTHHLSIRSILGMGGLGKTTLAQAVFNDDRVKEHFNFKIWVCVSNDFDLIKLTRAVLDSLPGGSCNSEQLAPLQTLLQEKLSRQRFLLVLDDVWNEDQEEWSRFKSSLECGAKGSSILVTTRLQTVASTTGTCPHYPLKILSKDDCWALFQQRAFGDGNEEKSNLVEIGKAIVQKCGGVPLAAKVLGGLLRFSANESEWLYVRDNKILDLQHSDNTILPALKLSYNHLSPHWRQCFAFCSIFPQDFRMNKEEVINLWMANGLLQQREGTLIEEIGDEIVESLVWRSLFEVAKRDEERKIISFVMHDLVHDLASSIAKSECCNVDWSHQKVNVSKGIRHLNVGLKMNPSLTIFQSIHQSTPKLRTLILDARYGIELQLPDVWVIFKCLRALSVQNLETELPASIGNLKHLRYLDLSYGEYEYLPESISGLRNLQTLNLKYCFNLKALPKYLSNLTSLRNLDIEGCQRLSKMPKDMGRKTCLQKLCLFIVGSNKGQYITELGRMDNLRGELEIRCLEKVRSGRDAEGANLMRKKGLRILMLEWSDDRTTEEEGEENDEEVLEGLRPDSNLRRLDIENYNGVRFPSWLEYSILPNLVEIRLIECKRWETLPLSLGRLPFLKKLEVTRMTLAKTLFSESDIDSDEVVNMFPSLEVLKIQNMPELEEWWSFTRKDGVEEQMFMFPSLKELTIEYIPKLTRLPTSPSLETLIVRKCNEMVLGWVKNLACLSRLEIIDINEVVCFPEGSLQNLIALEDMKISGLKKLKILPREAGDLSKLVEFDVFGCDELVSLPQVGKNCLCTLTIRCCKNLTYLKGVMSGSQTTLRHLWVYECPKLEWSSLEFEHLSALKIINIGGFPEMTSLPDGIQHLSSTLQSLYLEDLYSLSSLPPWIGSLTQLQFLNIISCKKLTMLPDELRHLTNLQTLKVAYCHPDLERRCENTQGEDWHKISHIPKLDIYSSA